MAIWRICSFCSVNLAVSSANLKMDGVTWKLIQELRFWKYIDHSSGFKLNLLISHTLHILHFMERPIPHAFTPWLQGKASTQLNLFCTENHYVGCTHIIKCVSKCKDSVSNKFTENAFLISRKLFPLCLVTCYSCSIILPIFPLCLILSSYFGYSSC